MLRRKQDENLKIEEQASALRNRLNERKERLKARPAMEGLSKEEQDAMMKNYQMQLETLDNAYLAEKRRQDLLMQQKRE